MIEIDCTDLFRKDPFTIYYHIMVNASAQEINDKYKTLPDATFIFPFTTKLDIDYSELTKAGYIMRPMNIDDTDLDYGDFYIMLEEIIEKWLYDPNYPKTKIERIL